MSIGRASAAGLASPRSTAKIVARSLSARNRISSGPNVIGPADLSSGVPRSSPCRLPVATAAFIFASNLVRPMRTYARSYSARLLLRLEPRNRDLRVDVFVGHLDRHVYFDVVVVDVDVV